MNEKRVYIWQLADFLSGKNKVMSGEDLAAHLNLNGILTEYESEYQGGRGVYTLIRNTYHWLHDELELKGEASKIAQAFVTPDGTHAWLNK
jgi:hypothetical protein